LTIENVSRGATDTQDGSEGHFCTHLEPNFAENGAWSHLKVCSAIRLAMESGLSNLSENNFLRQSSRQLAPYDSYSILRPASVCAPERVQLIRTDAGLVIDLPAEAVVELTVYDESLVWRP
jgi:hypothetical protein